MRRFDRTVSLIGEEGLKTLIASKVAVFGIGGVGSFAVEALARAGIGNLVLVDHDHICITNINRQIHAITDTIGELKAEAMRRRVLDINPYANVYAITDFYCTKHAEKFFPYRYDYVIDAMDTVLSKIDLIERCKSANIPIISSMGTGNKLNPALFKIEDIYNTDTCPLAKVMRKELRKKGIGALKVIYSVEKPIVQETPGAYGSISFVPSVAGLMIAGEAIKNLLCKGGHE